MTEHEAENPRRHRDPAEIRAEIDRARAEVAASLLTLRAEVEHRLDWRVWVRRRPHAAVAIALAIGYWLGRR